MSLIKHQSETLQKHESPERAVARVQTFSEARELHDRARMLHAAWRKVEESREQQNYFAEVSLRAARECGRRLLQLQLALRRQENLKQGPHKVRPSVAIPSLDELGISKDQSSRFQKLARIDKVVFEKYLREARRNAEDISVEGLHRFAKKPAPAPASAPAGAPLPSGPLDALAQKNRRFRAIYVDARGLENVPNKKSARSLLRDLRGAPLAALAEADCHLHLVLGGSLLAEVGTLLKRWGFGLLGSVAWSRPASEGQWPVQAEVLLAAVRGSLPFQQDPRSFEFLTPNHKKTSEEALFEAVRLISPGPYLRISTAEGALAVATEEVAS